MTTFPLDAYDVINILDIDGAHASVDWEPRLQGWWITVSAGEHSQRGAIGEMTLVASPDPVKYATTVVLQLKAKLTKLLES